MGRTRPTVTIDLEEYKELQEYRERFNNSVLGDYQTLLRIFSKYVVKDNYGLQAEIKENGLLFCTLGDNSTGNYDISVKRLKK